MKYRKLQFFQKLHLFVNTLKKTFYSKTNFKTINFINDFWSSLENAMVSFFQLVNSLRKQIKQSRWKKIHKLFLLMFLLV